MKEYLFLVTLSVVVACTFSTAQAVTAIDVELVSGQHGGDSVNVDQEVRWNLLFTNTYSDATSEAKVGGSTNGFRVYTKLSRANPATAGYFEPITYDTIASFQWKLKYDLICQINPFGVNGLGVDTVGVGGASLSGPGIAFGTISEPAFTIATTPRQVGDTLCLDSITVYPPGNPWIWSMRRPNQTQFTITPTWGGPFCYHIHGAATDQLLVDSASLTFEVAHGSNADTSTIEVTSSGGAALGELGFTMTADQPWLTFDTAGGSAPSHATFAGTTPMAVLVIADVSGLDPGSYAATITISAPGATNPTSLISTDLSVGTEVQALDSENLPTSFALEQNYPNPFNPTTDIRFDVPVRSHVTLTIYNVIGQKVHTLVDQELAPNSYLVTWDGTTEAGNRTSSGVYFYKLVGESFVSTKKMVLLK